MKNNILFIATFILFTAVMTFFASCYNKQSAKKQLETELLPLYDEYSVEIYFDSLLNPLVNEFDNLENRTVTWTKTDIGQYIGNVEPDINTTQIIFVQNSLGSNPNTTFITGNSFPGDLYLQAFINGVESEMSGSIYLTAKIYNQ